MRVISLSDSGESRDIITDRSIVGESRDSWSCEFYGNKWGKLLMGMETVSFIFMGK